MSNALTPEAQAELEKMQQKWRDFRRQLEADLGQVDMSIRNLASAAATLGAAEQHFFMQAAGAHMQSVIDGMFIGQRQLN